MKLLRTLLLFDKGGISRLPDWALLHGSLERAVSSIHFPDGTGSFTLRRKALRDDGQWNRNGVVYLKQRFFESMVEAEHWTPEAGISLDKLRVPTRVQLYPSMEDSDEPIATRFGSFDFVTVGAAGLRVAIEWETGNISSSHRSLNKLAMAVKAGIVDAGVTVVPSRALYEHLTDRIGNINELSGYLSMWKGLGESIERGLLSVVVVEHDSLCDDGDYLPVGKDGRSAEGMAKRL